jgi:uncharacterized membrane protein YfcA
VLDSPAAVAGIVFAGFAGGAVNAIAGGGTNLSFPALLWLGLPPVAANATSAVALWPGSWSSAWAFRRVLRQARRQWLWLLVPSLLGGTLGAWLLVELPAATFRGLAPWLVLASTLLFVVEPWLRRHLGPGAGAVAGRRHLALAHLAQLGIAVYGGYFGAGIGILMLASLGFSGVDSLAQANGLKNLLAAAIKAAAVVYLAVAGPVVWGAAAVMAVGAVAGGLAGGALALRLPATWQRVAIVLLGLVMTVATFVGLA